MLNVRRWKEWPGRAVGELNIVSGVATFGGCVASLAGWLLATGPFATVLTYGGILIIAFSIGIAIVRSTPPIIKRPEDLVGKTIPLSEVKNISPAIMTLAVVGPSMVGKTTLKDRLSFADSGNVRTQAVSAYIANFQTSPPTHIAILDGGGELYSHQLELAEYCQCLCVVIDHNSSDSDAEVDVDRLAKHREFSKQIRQHLDKVSGVRKTWVRLLINKHDLWGTLSSDKQQLISDFYTEELDLWRQGNRAVSTESLVFSNEDASDVARFVEKLKQTAAI
ncbi:hypothetical protein [Pseudomonas sp. H2_H09]